MAGVPQQIITGARAILNINGTSVGLFTTANFSVTYDVLPNFILGRMSAAEITYAGADAVSISASGFRVVNAGAYQVAGLPKLQELLGAGEITISLIDRQTGAVIGHVDGVKATGFSTAVTARSVSDFTVNFLGRIYSDESGSQGEGGGVIAAPDLLSGTSVQTSST